ncbi:MAG: hypothetical protein HND27_04705 [Bacteroidetes bacterium]|nr:hypothetical protein [Bacteroidota bacterium]MCL4816173.1 hypothetical protein [Flavobacteriales bacterium]WKZ74446.1 MAG: hypothetical protein QY303_09855 [Vicingaceae bacterium]NOG95059.1 hypothetical protein [Bacteroidota bacterium]CAG0952712.1 hypothetical protein FLAV_00274 [Flavobacteriales bacterium]
MAKNIFTTLFFLLIFLVGYFREAVFLVLNTVIHNYPFPYNAVYSKPPNFLYEISTSHLLLLKWVLTGAFSLLFMAFTMGLIHLYFKHKEYNKLVLWVYALLLVVSGFITLLGLITGHFEDVYTFSRFVVGLAQSPLTSLVLFVFIYFKSKTENNKSVHTE